MESRGARSGLAARWVQLELIDKRKVTFNTRLQRIIGSLGFLLICWTSQATTGKPSHICRLVRRRAVQRSQRRSSLSLALADALDASNVRVVQQKHFCETVSVKQVEVLTHLPWIALHSSVPPLFLKVKMFLVSSPLLSLTSPLI